MLHMLPGETPTAAASVMRWYEVLYTVCGNMCSVHCAKKKSWLENEKITSTQIAI